MRSFKKELLSLLSSFVALIFVLTILSPVSYAQNINVLNLPAPGKMVYTSPAFVPVLLKGMIIHPEDPLKFDFIIDSGNSTFSPEEIRKESERLVKYFLASMTVPKNDLWVNLSPYEKDRIISEELGKTELGRDMLAQDYLLKQLTASLIYPEKDLGKKFWDKVYQQAQEKLGTNDIPLNTFNKVWIIPQSATVYENGATVYIVQSRLKVMLDEDYLALQNNQHNEKLGTARLSAAQVQRSSSASSQVVREIVLPEIEKEVNEGKNFSLLRQIYHSLILAKWYKEVIKSSLLSKIYIDQGKVSGIQLNDAAMNDRIYQRYMKAYKKGVFSFIKEDYDQLSQKVVPRKYFSGGIKDADIVMGRTINPVSIKSSVVGANYTLAIYINPIPGKNREQDLPVVKTAGESDHAMQAESNEDALIKKMIEEVAGELDRPTDGMEFVLSRVAEALQDEKATGRRPSIPDRDILNILLRTMDLSPYDLTNLLIKRFGRRTKERGADDHLGQDNATLAQAKIELAAARAAIEPEAQQLVDFFADRAGNQHGPVDAPPFNVDDAKAGIMPVIHAVGSPAPESFFNAADYWKKYMRILEDAGVKDKNGNTPNVPLVITNGRGRGYRRLVINTMWLIKEKRKALARGSEALAEFNRIVQAFRSKFRSDLKDLRLATPLDETQDKILSDKLMKKYEAAIVANKGQDRDDKLNEAQVIKLLFELNGVPERDENGRQIIYLEQQSSNTFANMKAGYPVLKRAVLQTYGQGHPIKIHVIADAFHRLRVILQAKRDLIAKHHLGHRWFINGDAPYIPTFHNMNDEQLFFYLEQMIGGSDEYNAPFGEIGRLSHVRGNEAPLERYISPGNVSFNREYKGWKERSIVAPYHLRTVLLGNYRNAKRQYDALVTASGTSPVQSDGAMVAKKEVGGIDLNEIEFKRQGSGSNIQMDSDKLRPILESGIDGFAPVIINLTPVPTLSFILGLAPQCPAEEFQTQFPSGRPSLANRSRSP